MEIDDSYNDPCDGSVTTKKIDGIFKRFIIEKDDEKYCFTCSRWRNKKFFDSKVKWGSIRYDNICKICNTI
jgi:hypothetical protein